MPTQHERYMAAALRLGRRHLGQTGVNPSVAALIVEGEGDDAVIIGRGVTAHGGTPHAEVVALKEAGPRAKGATVYVTLEPCAKRSHELPCSDSLIKAGVRRVVVAVGDVNPPTDGCGIGKLRAAGIDVVSGVLSHEAAHDHAGHSLRVIESRPFVQMKMALTANGMIGRKGERLIVSCPAAQAFAQRLRSIADAIAIGIGTALADDPLLTCRLPGMEERSPKRFVFDRHLKLPLASQLVKTAKRGPLTLLVGESVMPERIQAFTEQGVSVKRIAEDDFLKNALRHMSESGITRLLLEAGAGMAQAFMADDLVDQALIMESTKTYDGDSAIAAFSASDWTKLTASDDFKEDRDVRIGEDRLRSFWRMRKCLQA